MRITSIRAVLLAIVGGLAVVAAVTYAYGSDYVHTPGGAAIAARVTARYSALVFALALAMRSRPQHGVPAMYAFVAAHFIHFAKVADVIWVDPQNPVHQMRPMALLVLGSGVLLTALIGFTNGARAEQIWRGRVNRFTVYLALLLFVVALGSNVSRYPTSVPPLIVLLFAMGYHLYSHSSLRRAQLAKGNA